MLGVALLTVGLIGQVCPECATLPPAVRADVSVRVNSPEVVPTPAPSVESPVEAGMVYAPNYGRCRVVVDASTGRAFLLKHRNARSEVVAFNGVRVGVSAGNGRQARDEGYVDGGVHVRAKHGRSWKSRVRVRCR